MKEYDVMETIFYALLSSILVSSISLIGVFTLSLSDKTIKRMLLYLVGFAAGGLMGGAFLHLLPESLEGLDAVNASLVLLFGFSIFFLLERVLKWRHCHEEHCEIHSFAYLSLVGDTLHNFLDGLIIAASFITAIPLGFATTFAVMIHEIPQEIGDFGILVYGGFSKKKALLYNFITALTAVVGVIVGFIISGDFANFSAYILPIAAGGFIYVASSDLIPEMHKENDMLKSMSSFACFMLGIIVMYLFLVFFE